MNIDTDRTIAFLVELLNTPSPTGSTARATDLCEQRFREIVPGDATFARTGKNALRITLPGSTDGPGRAVTAHVDTLGAMVKRIKENGRLELTMLGGYLASTVAGAYCVIETESGGTLTGTAVLKKQSVHVHRSADIHALGDDFTNIEIRLDERVATADAARELGVRVGDFVAWNPRCEVTPRGFVKSRHLDDKASVASVFGAVDAMTTAGVFPTRTTHLYFSNHEEVGHGGASGIPDDVAELVAVDMGALGEGQAGDEYSVSICVKDASGPYDRDLTRQLVALCEAEKIPFHRDVYVHYGSDGSAALRAGLDARVALIGPGVDASHAYERTHQDAVVASARLLGAYLRSP